MTNPYSPLSIYLHVPFCKHRCAYCDFNTYAHQEDLIPAYVDALIHEIEFVGRVAQRIETTIQTIFFGGGTPSLLSPLQFDSVLNTLRGAFTLTPNAEVSIEANPGTVSLEYLTALRKTGINRISFGAQSSNTEELRMLERIHDFLEVIDAVKFARKAGFDNINLDLIYGLPNQKLETWQTTVKRILDLHPEHISAYALTIEHGTPFGKWASKGLLSMPDPDLAAEMYEWTMDYLESNGYIQYEISNWAKANSEFMCRHNLQYWRGLPYLGFGAGAHGYANGYRYSNALRIKTYIERLAHPQLPIANYPITPASVSHHKQTPRDDMGEYMMTGLRLTREGVSADEFEKRFGQSLRDAFGKEIDELIGLGLLEWLEDMKIVRLTRRGRLLGNQVFMRFVD